MTAFSPGRFGSRGFTMLEIIVATMILFMTAMGAYKFVNSNLRAISLSEETTLEEMTTERFFSYVQEQLHEIPPRGRDLLKGEALKLNNVWLDSIEWKSRGGIGLLTRGASGEYLVKLRIQPAGEKSTDYEIGLWRRPVKMDTETGLVEAGSDKDATFVPLLRNVSGLHFRYFDQRLGQWVNEWKDVDVRPLLVEVNIWKKDAAHPNTSVIMVPSAKTQQ